MTKRETAASFVNDSYDISVTGRHVLVTEAMKNYAIEKLSKLDKFSDRIIDVHVAMDIQKLEHRVDIVMSVNHMKIKSSSSSEDMYISIDRGVEKLQRQLNRYKDKLREHQSPHLADIEMAVHVIKPWGEEQLTEINSSIEDESERELVEQYRPHQIVAQEQIPLKTLNYEEAVMKMELSGDVFLIFRNEVDRQLKVIYRRSDGNYGIIEPEHLPEPAHRES